MISLLTMAPAPWPNYYSMNEHHDFMLAPADPVTEPPKPAYPVEVHSKAKFDPEQAWRATLLACRGQ